MNEKAEKYYVSYLIQYCVMMSFNNNYIKLTNLINFFIFQNNMVRMHNSQLHLDSTKHEDALLPLIEGQIVGYVLDTRSGYIKGVGLLPRGQYKKQRSSDNTSINLENQFQLKKEVEHLKSKVGMLTNFIMSNFSDFPSNKPNDNQAPSSSAQAQLRHMSL